MAKAPVFYLGTHMDGWLAHVGVPLFVSHRRLARRKTLPKARSGWALDSGGYSELSLYGGWRTTPEEYVCRFSKFVAKSHINWRMVANSPHQGEIVGSAQYPTGVKHLAVSRSPAISPVRFRRKTDDIRESQKFVSAHCRWSCARPVHGSAQGAGPVEGGSGAADAASAAPPCIRRWAATTL